MIINSEWMETGTPAQLEERIGNGFRWLGPGVYLGRGEFSIIVPHWRPFPQPSDWNPWKREWPDGTLFDFHHWNVPIESTVFCWTPITRIDNR